MIYKARLVHSPLDRRYILQIKLHWWTPWEKIQEDEYREEGKKPERYYPMYTQTELCTKYLNRIDEIVSEKIVYMRKGKK